MLLGVAGYAIGFGFRPLGAIMFGFLGDRLGRKYTCLVTVTLMGIATAGVGLVPGAASIGLWAPGIVITLRILQGLALGGGMAAARSTFAKQAPRKNAGTSPVSSRPAWSVGSFCRFWLSLPSAAFFRRDPSQDGAGGFRFYFLS